MPSASFNVDLEVASVFERAIIQGEVYHSNCYHRTQVRNSYTVEYTDGDIGFINFLESSTVVVITPLIPTSNSCYPQCLSVLSKCIVPVTAVAAKYILHKCVCIGLHDIALLL